MPVAATSIVASNLNPRRYLAHMAAAFLIPVLGTAVVNYQVDPGHVFSDGRYEKDFATLMLQGQDVILESNLDERQLQLALIRSSQQTPDVIAIGSSRTMNVGSAAFPGRRFLNHSVSGATIEDLVGILGLYESRSTMPHTVVLGVEAWMLNAAHGQDRWMALRDSYEAMCKKLDVLPTPSGQMANRAAEAFSLRYLLTSIQTAEARHWASQPPPRASQPGDANSYLKRHDGSVRDPVEVRTRAASEVRTQVLEHVRHQAPYYLLGSFQELDPRYMSHITALIRHLRARATHVILFLPPYHPLLYEALENQPAYHCVKAAEDWYRHMAAAEGAEIIGSFDPGRCRCTESDFSDEKHPRPGCIDQVFGIARSMPADHVK